MTLIKTGQYIKPGADKAIFFLGPYATSLQTLRWPIRALQRSGYSVIAYEYPRTIFNTGEPDRVQTAIDETRAHIKASIKQLQRKGYHEFGFVGSSLGSFVAYNCLGSVPELDWGVMITGGDIADAIWGFASERERFGAKGYTLPGLKKAWHHLQYSELGDLRGKRYLFIASRADKVTHYKGALESFGLVTAAGPDTKVITHRKLSHRTTVVRNFFRIRKLVKRVQSQVD